MTPRAAAKSLALLILAVLGGCTDDRSSVARPVTFATFNAALVAHAEHVELRAARIAEDLMRLDADVLCLQEVWEPEHVEFLARTLEGTFPHGYWSVASASGSIGCDASETESLIGCMHANCAEEASTTMAACAVAHCANHYAAVSSRCQACVLAHQTEAPAGIAASCQLDTDSVAYANQNGLMLLSKYPLEGKDYLPFDSSLGDRGALFGQISTELLQKTDLFCTHLAASMREVTYVGPYGSWDGERLAQIDRLMEFQENRNGAMSVLMGDMNCGPETNELVGEHADGFNRLLAQYDVPYSEHEMKCTHCGENDVMGIGGPNVMIDHVLFSMLPERLSRRSHRFFDEPIQLDVDGISVRTYRSDHYGLMVRLDPSQGR